MSVRPADPPPPTPGLRALLLLGLMRLLAACPLRGLHALGRGLGWLAWWGSGRYRQRFRRQARQAGHPEAAWGRAIGAAGELMAELAPVWGRPAGARLPMPVGWQGADRLDAALAAGRGVILLTPHLGSFEVAAQAIAERFAARHGPITVLYRPPRQAWLEAVIDTGRRRPGVQTAPASLGGVRQMIRALRRGEAVGLLPDQVPPGGQGAWAPWFGRPAYTMTLVGRLVEQTGAAVLLLWAERLPRGQGYAIQVEPGPSGEAGAPPGPAAINAAMEAVVRRCPDQYLWGYHRYKAPRGGGG